MSKFINLNKKKNEYINISDSLNNTSSSVFTNFINKIKNHTETYSLKDDLLVFIAYGVYLEILDCSNLNEPDYKKICVLDFFFRSCQYLEFLNIHHDSGCKNLQLLYYLFMIHRTKFNKDLDPKNILIFITQQIIKSKNETVGEEPETVVEEPENLFELLNNNYRYWNYYIKILDITQSGDVSKIDTNKEYSLDNNDSSPLTKSRYELCEYFNKQPCFIKYKTSDFYVPLQTHSDRKINDSFLPYSCYQFCRTFEITTKAEIESQEHMDNYFKTEHLDDNNILTNEPVNNNGKNLIGEDVIKELIKANPEYVRKFDTIDTIDTNEHTILEGQQLLVNLDDKYCKLLVEYNLSYLCLKLTNIILQDPTQVEDFKDVLNDKEKLYFQRVCQHI